MLRPTMSDPRGEPVLSFPDPVVMGWGGLLAGLFCLGGGLAIALGVIADGVRRIDGDLIAVFFLVGMLLLFGGALSFVALRDVLGKPTWHVSRTHAWRVRGGRTVDLIALREQPAASVVDTRRNGVTVWFAVQLGAHSIVAPSQDAAHRIAELWQSARRG